MSAVVLDRAPTRGQRVVVPVADALRAASRATAAAGIVGLPLLVPAGPGNTGPSDALIVLCLAATGYAAAAGALRWRMPFALPLLLFVVAGAVGGLAHDRPVATSLALAQDLLLLAWAGALATVARDRATLDHLLRLWARVAIAWSAVLVLAVATGSNRIAGVTAAEGQRTAFTFGDPNRAGSYFALSLFVVLAARPMLRRWTVRLGSVSILLAMLYTGSNAALLAVLGGLGVGMLISVARTSGAVAAVALGTMLALLGLVVVLFVDVSAIQDQARSGGRILANSLARSGQGSEDRRLLLSENLALYQSDGGGLLGTGPGGTKPLLASRQSAYVKEAHNDLMAALIERGPLGVLALGLLIGAVGLACVQVSRAPDRVGSEGPGPHLYWLVGGAVSIAVFGWFHEALHFRHAWALLGLLAAASALETPRRRTERDA